MNQTSSSTPFEIVRRLLFFVLIIFSVIAFTYEDLSPLVVISKVEKEDVQNNTVDESNSLIDKAKRIANKFKDEIKMKKGQIKVDSTEWKDIFNKAEATFNDNSPKEGWKDRISANDLDWHNIYYIFFKPNETPIDSIYDKLKDNKTHILKLTAKEPQYLEISIKRTEIHGLNGPINDVPSAFAYPFRKNAGILLLLAFTSYLILPRPKKDPNTIRMKGWRIVLADFSAYLLFLPFFALPLFIIGGFKTATSEYIIFTAVFWLISILGLILIYWSIKFSKHEIKVGTAGFWRFSLGRQEEFKFEDIEYIQRATIRAPKELAAGSLAAGIASPEMAGAGLLAAANSNGGLYVKTKDNRSAYIWYSDSFGNIMLNNFEVLTNALEVNKVPIKEEMLNIRAVFPPER